MLKLNPDEHTSGSTSTGMRSMNGMRCCRGVDMKNPPDGWPRIAPAVFYNDAAVAIDWLARAFGFTVREKVENDEGRIVHSQLVLDGGLIMVGQVGLPPDRTYPRSPLAVGGAKHAGAGRIRRRRRCPLRAGARGRRGDHGGAGDPGLRQGLLLGGPQLRGARPRRAPLVVRAAPALTHGTHTPSASRLARCDTNGVPVAYCPEVGSRAEG